MDDRTNRQNFVDAKSFFAQEDIDFYWNKIKFSLYMDDYWKQTPMASDNAHPGTETHKAFATAIYNEIKDEIT